MAALFVSCFPVLSQAEEKKTADPDDWSVLYFCANPDISEVRRITKIEIRVFGNSTFEKQRPVSWSETIEDAHTLESVERALHSALRPAVKLDYEVDAGDLPFGYFVVHTTNNKFGVEMRRGFSIDGFNENDRFYSWFLAKIIDYRYHRATRKHLDVEQFESLTGQKLFDSERVRYYEFMMEFTKNAPGR
jgi:hypothetical protein